MKNRFIMYIAAAYLAMTTDIVSAQQHQHGSHAQHTHQHHVSEDTMQKTSDDATDTDPHQHHGHHHHQPAKTSVIPQLAEPQQATYVCPMHPQIRQGEPGSCPICGMDLVLQKAATSATHTTVNVSGEMQQALGIRTATAGYGDLSRTIRTQGMVRYPEDAIQHSHVRAEGWIEQLYVRTTGQQVKAGDKLFSYYAPDLVVAQDDYLQAWSIRNTPQGSNLLQRAETRLRLLGLNTTDIQHLQQYQQSQHRITAYASHNGIVTALNIRDGMFISPGDTLLEITDLSKIWLIADIPQAQQSWLSKGMHAHITLPAYQQELHGMVDYLYPELDSRTRTLQARIVLNNPARRLAPNSVIPVELQAEPKKQVLLIPREAILLAATTSRVIIRHQQHFSVREIKTGISADGYTEILSGLQAGEEVVVSGQFLLDAEASLNALPASQGQHNHHH